MATHRLLFLPIILILALSPLKIRAQQVDFAYRLHDAIYSQNTTYTIEPDKRSGYKLSSITQIRMICLVDLESQYNLFKIDNPYVAKISKIEGTYHGKKLKKKDISSLIDDREAFFTTGRIYVIHFPDDMKKGDELTYSYKSEYSNIAFFPLHLIPNETLVDRYQVTINHPTDFKFDFEYFFPRDTIKFKISNPSPNTTIISLDSLPKSRELPYFPYNRIQTGFMTIISDRNGTVTPSSPGDFVKWYCSLLNTLPKLTDSLPAVLKGKLDSATNSLSSLKSINDYIRSNVRYMGDARGMGIIVPQTPSFVLANLYGDCKDRSFLAKSLAEKVNIPVELVLAAGNGIMEEFENVHIMLFNHMICAGQDSAGPVFFDPILKYHNFGNLPGSMFSSRVFIIDTLRPRYCRILSPNFPPQLEVSITGSVARAESCIATVYLKGDYYAAALASGVSMNMTEKENFLSTMLTTQLTNISIDRFQLITQSDSMLSFSAIADLTGFIINSDAKKYIPGNVFISFKRDILERANDNYPIYLEMPTNVSLTLNLKTDGYNIVPDSIALRCRDSVSYKANAVSGNEENCIITYNLSILSKRFDDYYKQEFINFCGNYLKNNATMFMLQGDKQ